MPARLIRVLKSSAQIVPFWPDVRTAAGDGNVVVTLALLVFLGTMVQPMVTGRRAFALLSGIGHGCGLLVFLAPGLLLVPCWRSAPAVRVAGLIVVVTAPAGR